MGSDFLTEKTRRAAAFRIDCNLSIRRPSTRNTDEYGVAIVYLADHDGTNKGQQGMLKEVYDIRTQ